MYAIIIVGMHVYRHVTEVHMLADINVFIVLQLWHTFVYKISSFKTSNQEAHSTTILQHSNSYKINGVIIQSLRSPTSGCIHNLQKPVLQVTKD